MPWSWQIRKQPPEQSYQLAQPVVEDRKWLRGTSRKILILQCVIALGLLLAIYQRTGDQTAHVLLGLGMLFAMLALLFRNRRDPFDPRPLNASSTLANPEMDEMLHGATEDPLGGASQAATESSTGDSNPSSPEPLVPEGAKRISDLKDLPPELAANPDVQKMLQKAGARGAWVKISSRDKSSDAGVGGDTKFDPEKVTISVTVKRSGQSSRFGATETMSEIPSELTSGDPKQMLDWVKSRGMLPPDASDVALPANTLHRLKMLVVCAAIAAAGGCLWVLYFNK